MKTFLAYQIIKVGKMYERLTGEKEDFNKTLYKHLMRQLRGCIFILREGVSLVYIITIREEMT